MTITLRMPPALEAKVRDQAAREGIDESTLVLQAVEKQFGPSGAEAASIRESELLLHINEGPPDEVWQKYHALSAKRDAESLTPPEHEELVRLSSVIEAADVKRLGHLIELARLRGVDLRTVRAQVGIPESRTSAGQNDA